MKEIVSTFTSTGQLIIPAEVRKHLGLTAGDTLFLLPDGSEGL